MEVLEIWKGDRKSIFLPNAQWTIVSPEVGKNWKFSYKKTNQILLWENLISNFIGKSHKNKWKSNRWENCQFMLQKIMLSEKILNRKNVKRKNTSERIFFSEIRLMHLCSAKMNTEKDARMVKKNFLGCMQLRVACDFCLTVI